MEIEELKTAEEIESHHFNFLKINLVSTGHPQLLLKRHIKHSILFWQQTQLLVHENIFSAKDTITFCILILEEGMDIVCLQSRL